MGFYVFRRLGMRHRPSELLPQSRPDFAAIALEPGSHGPLLSIVLSFETWEGDGDGGRKRTIFHGPPGTRWEG